MKGWLDKYQEGGVAKTDATRTSPALNYRSVEDSARIEREKELARRKTSVGPQSKPSVAMKQAAEERYAQQKRNEKYKKAAEYAQVIGGGLEVAAPFTGPLAPIIGGAGTITSAGSSAYLSGRDVADENYGSALMNAGFGGLGIAGYTPAARATNVGGVNVAKAANAADYVSDVAGTYRSLDEYGRKVAEQTRDIHQRYSRPIVDNTRIDQTIKNQSGFTKERALEKASEKTKEAISKMSDEEFANTIIKPNGEIGKKTFSTKELTKYQEAGKMQTMSTDEYVNAFNSKLDLLNDIITRNNKSGIDYKVTGIDADGNLQFFTPKQGDITGGNQSWSTKLVPGEFRGAVEDIDSPMYYEFLPGINIKSSAESVFPDALARRGTRTYESINEYLKLQDLGRVKTGFNNQSKEALGLWENAIKKEKAFGYYNYPHSVYGAMKKNGGWLEKYNDGGPVQPNYNDYSVSAGPGFQGDGYSNVGRNYSPAWGGQFQDGGKVITSRKDFSPGILSNVPGLSSLASGNQPGYNRHEQYGPLGDLYRYYGGLPLEHDVLIESQSKPAKSKDKNAKYISLNRDQSFVNEVLDNYKRVSSGKLDKGESKLGDDNWQVSGYSSAGKDAHKTIKQGSEHHSNAIGRYTLGKGKDEKGEYISYYDKFDQGTGLGINPGELLGLTKPFEIYDRIYVDPKTGKPKMAMGGPVKRFMQPTETFKNYGYNPKENEMSTEYSTSIGGPGEVYLVPGYRQGRLLNDPEATFNMYGEHLGGPFKTVQAAEDFAQLRHKYVEQNKNIPAPFKTRDYAMGGSIGGATQGIPGATGFMYARTGSTPSKAKGRNKEDVTDASAENGKEMKFYQEGLDFKPKSMQKGGKTTTRFLPPQFKRDEEEEVKPNPILKNTIEEIEPEINGGLWKGPIEQLETIDPYETKIDRLKREAPKELIKQSSSPYRYNMLRDAVRHDIASERGVALTDINEDELTDRTEQLLSKKEKQLDKIPIKSLDYNLGKQTHAGWSPATNSIYISKDSLGWLDDDINNIGTNMFNSLLHHELRHSYDKGGEYLTNYEKKLIDDKRKKDISNENYLYQKEYNYLNTPQEITARLEQIRTYIKPGGEYDPSKDKATVENLNKAASGSDAYNDLLLLMSPQDIVDLLNTIATNNPKQGMPAAKNGKKVIKDDRGQWAHPGEITEIGSNQITMQGVPYPVMGISDTGDMQMMYPDEDYVYDGESVTEIPMMREGGTISKKTLARNQRIAESNAAQNQPLTPESLATRAIAIPDKLRLSEQMRNISPGLASWMEENPTMSYIDENLNPLVIAGKLASKLGQVPLNVKQGNYRQALLNTISPMLIREGAITTENLSKSKNKFEQGGQLTKLDQLTNFTNYNTKQPGGWLDKYQ